MENWFFVLAIAPLPLEVDVIRGFSEVVLAPCEFTYSGYAAGASREFLIDIVPFKEYTLGIFLVVCSGLFVSCRNLLPATTRQIAKIIGSMERRGVGGL
jgi:hypothetical protein